MSQQFTLKPVGLPIHTCASFQVDLQASVVFDDTVAGVTPEEAVEELIGMLSQASWEVSSSSSVIIVDAAEIGGK